MKKDRPKPAGRGPKKGLPQRGGKKKKTPKRDGPVPDVTDAQIKRYIKSGGLM
jgi:hypothetical protein